MTTADAEPYLPDFEAFLGEFSEESDRAGAIVAGAYLDELLRELLSASMIQRKSAVDDLLGSEKKMDRPLGTFSSRIRASFCMGLISDSEYAELLHIRLIRNRFAHAQHGCDFSDSQVVKSCTALVLPRLALEMNVPPVGGERNWFNVSVALCAAFISYRIGQARTRHPETPKDIKPGGLRHGPPAV